ncbi:DNA repair protein RecO [Candidatus Saccharibacteria bacterium RIFCSPHIGHO2_12_FULL_47_16b]|nr:MAG: DNA repair protein RecO [Candidatus Saccharibacteria bacterium RIFCSPHIGHO2_12_FULL_47_16b]
MSAKTYTTKGIVLSRTNFGEADRILTFLTKDHGKVRAIAKGVRKPKSKLAGGIELFSISHLTLIIGRGEINTIISSRLARHFGNLSSDLERVNLAAALIKRLNRVTEDKTEPDYFNLLAKSFKALDNLDLKPNLVELWFDLQLLKQAGHAPNLRRNALGQPLEAKRKYNFDIEKMAFSAAPNGEFNANHIKFLRLYLGLNRPQAVGRINGASKFTKDVRSIVEAMLKSHLRV